MEYSELMKKRTSSRAFAERQLTGEELDRILEAGMRAPVGSNRYGDLHLTVVEDREILRRLSEAALIGPIPSPLTLRKRSSPSTWSWITARRGGRPFCRCFGMNWSWYFPT